MRCARHLMASRPKWLCWSSTLSLFGYNFLDHSCKQLPRLEKSWGHSLLIDAPKSIECTKVQAKWCDLPGFVLSCFVLKEQEQIIQHLSGQHLGEPFPVPRFCLPVPHYRCPGAAMGWSMMTGSDRGVCPPTNWGLHCEPPIAEGQSED